MYQDHSPQSSLANLDQKFSPLSPFGEIRVAEQTQQINLKSIYGISVLRDVVTENASATVTNGNAEYRLKTTANGTDVAILESAERGRYIAGQSAFAGMGVRLSDVVTGDQVVYWGYYDENNGFGFGANSSGAFVFRRSNGVETKTYQTNWNIDKADGTGPSSFLWNAADGLIYQISFSWYGYGVIEYNIIAWVGKSQQRVITLHRERITGSVSIENPNLPLRAEVNNNGEAAAFDSLYVAGRQFSVLGKFDPFRRISSERRLSLGSIATTFLPLVTMRRKSAFSSVSAKVQGFDIITDFDAVVEVRINGSLSGASYNTPSDHTASETAMESDVSATAITGGEIIYQTLIDSSGTGLSAGGSATIILSDIDLVREQPVTVCIRRISGTGGTASCVLRIAEEW